MKTPRHMMSKRLQAVLLLLSLRHSVQGVEPKVSIRGSGSRNLVDTGSHYIACGGNSCTNVNGDRLPVFRATDDELHEVRCCSDEPINWPQRKQRNNCPDAGSKLPALNNQCPGPVDYDTAAQLCADSSARLCTRDEVDDGCTSGSGCGFDNQFLWTSTPYEEPPPFVPSVSPSGSHVLVCGDPNSNGNGCRLDGEYYRVFQAPDEDLHEFACCSETELDWSQARQNNGCSVWGGSSLPVFEDYGGGTCRGEATFAEAEEACDRAGARLCTEQEVLDRCVKSTGCSINSNWIWTSSNYVPPEAITQSNGTHWLVCGGGNCRDANNDRRQVLAGFDMDEHPIRCCGDTELDWRGAVQRGSCPDGIWGGSEIPNSGTSGDGQCLVGTFAEADAWCQRGGGRLCTQEEALAGCTEGSGCDYNDEYVWTSTESPPAVVVEPTDGFHAVACGNPNRISASGCKNDGEFFPSFRAEDDEEHEVRCCSGIELPFFDESPVIKNEGCDVWSISELPLIPGIDNTLACFDDTTYWNAKYLCEINGARLCTEAEVLKGCARGSGCSFDSDWVWTSTPACASEEECDALAHADKYVGCYEDTRRNRQLPFRLGKPFSIDLCYSACLAAGYAYFGLSNGDTCSCGDDLDTTDVLDDEAGCSKRCKTGPGTCGGPSANSCFATGLPASRSYNFEDEYAGCFRETDDRFPVEIGTSESIPSCVEACSDQNYAVASLSEGGLCQCGNHRPTAASVSCLEPCTNGRGICGAAARADGRSVYRTTNDRPPLESLLQCTGAKSYWWGDPHFITFDGLSYNCQGLGHFVASQCADWELQIRTKSRPGSRASVTDGIAAKHKDNPVVQVNIAHSETEFTTTISDCPVHVLVGGELVNQTDTAAILASDGIDIRPFAKGFEIQFPEGGPALRVKIRKGRNCLLDVDQCVPEDCLDSTVGLLGTPNGNLDDEWTTRDGTPIFPRPSNYKSRGGYEYCTQEWCVQTEQASLFEYYEGVDDTFEAWDDCSADFPGDIAIEDADPEIVALCAGLANEGDCVEEVAEGNPVENVLDNNNDIDGLEDLEEPESPDTPPDCPEALRVVAQTGRPFEKWPLEVLSFDGETVELRLRSPCRDATRIAFLHANYGDEYALSPHCNRFEDVDGAFSETVTVRCLSSGYAAVSIFATDETAYGSAQGDVAEVPQCCHTPEAEDLPTVKYSFLVACKPVCPEDFEFEPEIN